MPLCFLRDPLFLYSGWFGLYFLSQEVCPISLGAKGLYLSHHLLTSLSWSFILNSVLQPFVKISFLPAGFRFLKGRDHVVWTFVCLCQSSLYPRSLCDCRTTCLGDFLGGPMVKNLISKAGDMGSIPGWDLRCQMPRATRPT